MKRLGELLIERGALEVGELRTALEACRRRGGRLGTQLLRFGFVEERALLEALSEQLGVPYIPQALLAKSPWAVRQAVPLATLQRLQAVPFERTQWRLRVAMANPRDPAAVEELALVAEIDIEPYVATESAISKTLKRLAEQEAQAKERQQPLQLQPQPQPQPAAAQPQPASAQPAAPQPPTAMEAPPPAQPQPVSAPPRTAAAQPAVAQPTVPARADWDLLWQPSRIGPDELFSCRGSRWRSDLQPLLSSFPDLAPVIEIPGMTPEEDLDDSLFLRRLQEAKDREDVGTLLIRFATRYLGRVCLFALHKNRVVGWMARGQGVVLDDVQSFSVALEESSLFLNAYRSGQYSLGTVPPEPASGRLVRVLGEPPPLDVFVAPIRVEGNAVAFLLGDNPGERGSGIATQELRTGADKAGIALEILAKKIRISS